ncbi:MAG: shikimate kinase [Muribaculaceae bacterium]|nr:shikimate kinase [Muribaculaceae bacterium]
MMKHVFLLGYMGCGKTTLGEVLARQMGVPYIDLDDYIEQRQGMTVTGFFATLGEDRFRQLETAALREVSVMSDVIIGCGGGTPCHGDNMALMNQSGITVWLTTSPERITARLLLPEQKSKRPKVAHLPDEAVLPLVERELQARTPFYSQAQLQFDSTDIETGPATERTARRLADLLASRQ